MKNKVLRIILICLVSAVGLFLAGFTVWGINPLPPEEIALEAIKSDAKVTIEDHGDIITFSPGESFSQTGIIFYPGGHVDPKAYAHLLRDISEEGYLVVLVKMPLNLAVLGSQKASPVMEQFPEVSEWILIGHSVGGAMASYYTANHVNEISGLVLWASYPPESTDLSQSGLPVLSIYASEDGLSTVAEVLDSRSRLPENAQFVEIPGGNHAQFGSYGLQKGDLPAQISSENQQSLIVQTTLDFLSSFDNK